MDNKDLELYSRVQMQHMLFIARRWTLHNPTGSFPDLPSPLYTYDRDSKAMKLDREAEAHYPEDKKPHWLIKLIFRL